MSTFLLFVSGLTVSPASKEAALARMCCAMSLVVSECFRPRAMFPGKRFEGFQKVSPTGSYSFFLRACGMGQACFQSSASPSPGRSLPSSGFCSVRGNQDVQGPYDGRALDSESGLVDKISAFVNLPKGLSDNTQYFA